MDTAETRSSNPRRYYIVTLVFHTFAPGRVEFPAFFFTFVLPFSISSLASERFMEFLRSLS